MHIRQRIERHLRESGLAPARFGRLVMGDPCFVFDLRNGREPGPATIRRVEAWLEAQKREPRHG